MDTSRQSSSGSFHSSRPIVANHRATKTTGLWPSGRRQGRRSLGGRALLARLRPRMCSVIFSRVGQSWTAVKFINQGWNWTAPSGGVEGSSAGTERVSVLRFLGHDAPPALTQLPPGKDPKCNKEFHTSACVFSHSLASFLQATSTVRWTRSPWRWSPSARVSLPSSMQHRTRALSLSRSPSTCRSISSRMVSGTPWEMSKESIFPRLIFFLFFSLCLFLLVWTRMLPKQCPKAFCFLSLFSPPNPVNSVYIDWQKGQQSKIKCRRDIKTL